MVSNCREMKKKGIDGGGVEQDEVEDSKER